MGPKSGVAQPASHPMAAPSSQARTPFLRINGFMAIAFFLPHPGLAGNAGF